MELSFGEQIKILLKRKGMTIRELAESIEMMTGKKMSRQNLTQRLVRDNFQEQDMRMIASVLGCTLRLSLVEGIPEEVAPVVAPKKEQTIDFKQAVDRQLTIEDVIKAAGEETLREEAEERAKAEAARRQAEEAAAQDKVEKEVRRVTARDLANKAREDRLRREARLAEEARREAWQNEARERARTRLEEEARLAEEARRRELQARQAEQEEPREQTPEEREQIRDIARRALEATHTKYIRFSPEMTEEEKERAKAAGQTEAAPSAEKKEAAPESVITETIKSEEVKAEPEEVKAEGAQKEESAEPAETGSSSEPAEPESSSELAEPEAAEPKEDAEEPAEPAAGTDREETGENAAELPAEEEPAFEEEFFDEEDEEPYDDEDNEMRLSPEELRELLGEDAGELYNGLDRRRGKKEETLLDAAKKDLEAKAALSNTADMGVVPDAFKKGYGAGDEYAGEIDPRTGREYESNVVRNHPKLIGYIQVYDREAHRWIDMTEWKFLGFQERKKVLLGAEYKPPIYLE